MNHLEQIQERFFKEDDRMKLGHLASDLARISTLVTKQMNSGTIRNVMEESKFFAEWTAVNPAIGLETQMLLAEVQSFVAQKQLELNREIKEPGWRREVSQCLRTWSSHLLEKAGFFEPNA